jgi:hypothetical protein
MDLIQLRKRKIHLTDPTFTLRDFKEVSIKCDVKNAEFQQFFENIIRNGVHLDTQKIQNETQNNKVILEYLKTIPNLLQKILS